MVAMVPMVPMAYSDGSDGSDDIFRWFRWFRWPIPMVLGLRLSAYPDILSGWQTQANRCFAYCDGNGYKTNACALITMADVIKLLVCIAIANVIKPMCLFVIAMAKGMTPMLCFCLLRWQTLWNHCCCLLIAMANAIKPLCFVYCDGTRNKTLCVLF